MIRVQLNPEAKPPLHPRSTEVATIPKVSHMQVSERTNICQVHLVHPAPLDLVYMQESVHRSLQPVPISREEGGTERLRCQDRNAQPEVLVLGLEAASSATALY